MKAVVIIIALTTATMAVVAQNTGISNTWLLGYSGGLGETKIDFYSGSPVISYYPIPMDFNHTHANISDSSGNLLFYTNGVYIADATHDTMLNGSGINPGAYSNFVPDGHLIAQGALIIKKPGWGNEYYLFHQTLDDYPTPVAYTHNLYLSIVDMNLNNGLGAVTLKNHPLLTDSLNVGKIAAVRHANGRDWWVIIHQFNTNMYYKLLVTPYGLPLISSTQHIGLTRWMDAGQAKFSPDGTRYAYYHYFDGLDIMNFDRCTGMFSNVVSDTTLPYIQGNVGCEFSPNSQLLYVTNILNTYQYDVTVGNPIASRIEVAAWDTFFVPVFMIPVHMSIPQLAPDGKIYITTGNSTPYLGSINNPDVPGVGCAVSQHSLILPTYNFNTLPNHPNYFLGKIQGSPCDTIIDSGWGEPPDITVGVYPNPSNGVFTLSYPAQREAGAMEVYDVNGKLVHRENVAQWSQFMRVEISFLSKGIYFCRMRWGEKESSTKVIIE